MEGLRGVPSASTPSVPVSWHHPLHPEAADGMHGARDGLWQGRGKKEQGGLREVELSASLIFLFLCIIFSNDHAHSL